MLTRIEAPDHEEVWKIADPKTGLTGFIALHSTALGPAAGGLRMRPYATPQEALEDVLRLSRGMTYKNAAAGLPLGGGKAVIIGDPARDKTPELLRAMGRAVDRLQGRYWTAEDMGMSPADMRVIRSETGFVAGLEDGRNGSGDPSPVTARGIFNAMRVAARHRFGSPDLAGRRVLVQGLGHVGAWLCQYLHEAGATLAVTDTDGDRIARITARHGAEALAPESIYAAPGDIFAPCAIGGILNETTIPQLQVGLVVGGANNQLADDADADRLAARGILYAPDYVANGGGIINVATEILRIRDRDSFVAERLDALAATLDRILTRAAQTGTSPARIADATVAETMARSAA